MSADSQNDALGQARAKIKTSGAPKRITQEELMREAAERIQHANKEWLEVSGTLRLERHTR